MNFLQNWVQSTNFGFWILDFGFWIDPAPLAVRGLGILNFGFGIFSAHQGRGMNQKNLKDAPLSAI
ncbi:hypothetical protein FACHB389_20555 [Nostoc calcicola FACHB-389]|nr:hypothetical protein FACHB389_20555 [Nostoc calcicola FACHB-389]